jgi:hypothetical protein
MSLDFFKQYPQLDYDLYSNGSSIRITDIFRAAMVNTSFLPDDASSYTYYEIFDGDRPDIVSHKLYGTPKYYWTLFLLNERLRKGLNSEWPLSSYDFSKYVDREYGNYSAITILPQLDINGLGIIDMTIIPFNEKYLKYLCLAQFSGFGDVKIANIVGFDNDRYQLIIKNIHRRVNNTRIEISKESFVEKTRDYDNSRYNFYWDNDSIDKLPENTAEQKKIKADAYNESAILKEEWIKIVYDQLSLPQVDYIGWKTHKDSFTSPETYIFGKMIIPASNEFRWAYYFNAAHTYYFANSDLVRSAYDVLTDKNVIFPKFLSFNEYENDKNHEKRKIKIIRPDYIVEFSRAYFETLNS